MAAAVISGMLGGCGNDQITDSRQSREGTGITAHRDTEHGDLMHASCDKSSLCIVAISESERGAAGQCDDILHGTAQFNAGDIIIGIDAHHVIHKDLLDLFGSIFVLACRNNGRRQIPRDLFRVSRPGQCYETCMLAGFLQFIGNDLRQGHQRSAFDSLRGVRDELALRQVRRSLLGG